MNRRSGYQKNKERNKEWLYGFFHTISIAVFFSVIYHLNFWKWVTIKAMQKLSQHPKGILFDVDGTLTNLDRVITPSTQLFLQKLSKTEIQFGVCTGRHFSTLKNYIFPHFPQDALHITGGGGQIITSSGKVVWEHLIEASVIREITTTVEGLGGVVAFGNGNYLYTSDSLYEAVRSHAWEIDAKRMSKTEDMPSPLINVRQLNPAIREYIESLQNLNMILMEAAPEKQFYDITAAGINKATAAKIWAEKQGIPLEEVLACGDGQNDYQLFLVTGQSVALGQSPEILKNAATTVVAHTNEDGLANYLTEALDLK